MIKVTVDRNKWHRGQGGDGSMLLLNNGKMCCIGFLARKLGVTPQRMRCHFTLDSLHRRTDRELSFCNDYNSILTEAYNTNDGDTISDILREKQLVKLGKKMGVQFTFKG